MANSERIVILFYDGYERRLASSFSGRIQAHAWRMARYSWRTLRGKQARTGFYTAFLSLVLSLRKAGYEVRVNDLAYAIKHPAHPIGVAGYPSILEKLDRLNLPNPRIFGPGDFGPPDGVKGVSEDSRYKILTHPSQWFVDLYRPYCDPAKLAVMFVGIDTARWPSVRGHVKSNDVLIYDKIRWHRDVQVPAVLERVRRRLDQLGLSHTTLRYGAHNVAHFRAGLKASRTMIFLCEHETQGLAYQEALASDVPVLAWDERQFIDPGLAKFASGGLDVSSVPYFDERCGGRFRIDQFEARFDSFWEQRDAFQPRAYVVETLSLETAAAKYMELYDRLR